MQISQLHAGVSGRPLAIRARQHVAVGRSTQVIVAGKARIIGKESRIGKAPITVPAGVTFDVQGQTITVKVCFKHCTAPGVALGYVDGPLLISTAVPHPHGKHGFLCAGQRPRDVGDTPKPLVHRAGETGSAFIVQPWVTAAGVSIALALVFPRLIVDLKKVLGSATCATELIPSMSALGLRDAVGKRYLQTQQAGGHPPGRPAPWAIQVGLSSTIRAQRTGKASAGRDAEKHLALRPSSAMDIEQE